LRAINNHAKRVETDQIFWMIRNGGIAMIWDCFMVFKMIEEANLIEKGRST
jgi:hypothetical protein